MRRAQPVAVRSTLTEVAGGVAARLVDGGAVGTTVRVVGDTGGPIKGFVGRAAVADTAVADTADTPVVTGTGAGAGRWGTAAELDSRSGIVTKGTAVASCGAGDAVEQAVSAQSSEAARLLRMCRPLVT